MFNIMSWEIRLLFSNLFLYTYYHIDGPPFWINAPTLHVYHVYMERFDTCQSYS